MAVLSSLDLAELRRDVAPNTNVNYPKATINAAFQAIEDWFEANRASLGSAIDTAAPGVFNAARKQILVKYWLEQKFERGG